MEVNSVAWHENNLKNMKNSEKIIVKELTRTVNNYMKNLSSLVNDIDLLEFQLKNAKKEKKGKFTDK